MKLKSTYAWTTATLLLIVPSASLAADLDTIDWARVPGKTVTLLYPGQSTYQWLRSSGHDGARRTRTGAACTACHEGEEQKIGARVVKGGELEPTPPAGKDGSKQLDVQVAYDNENAYFRLRWKTKNPYPGEAYPMYRFDGTAWKPYGGPRLDQSVATGVEPPIYEDRISMMIDDGGVRGFAAQGCWLTCHEGERNTAKEATAAQVKESALYQAIKKTDVRKYLPATRTDANASWDKGVSLDEIAKLKSQGHFLDLVQWRAHRSNPVGMADDGYVLEWRNFDAGSNMWSSNMDAKTKQPRYMYDAAKVGRKAFTLEEIRKAPTALVPQQNTAAFDPNAGWKEGDLLPQYVVSRDNAKGSAADNKRVKGEWNNGVWTVTWARPLKLTNEDDKALQEGKVYNFGFAVHDDTITTRGHHVSFPVTVGFGTKAAIEATKLK